MPHRLGWAKVDVLRLYKLDFHGSEAGGGGSKLNYILLSLSREKFVHEGYPNNTYYPLFL